MKPRGSDTTELSLAITNRQLICCDVNPLTRRGRTVQAIGLVFLPLLSSVALSIYTSVLLKDVIHAFQDTKKCHNSVNLALETINTVVSLQEGVSVSAIELATNQTVLFGMLDEFFEKTVRNAETMQEWPAGQGLSNMGELHALLNNFRRDIALSKQSVNIGDMYIKSDKLLYWVQNKILDSCIQDNWKLVGYLNNLLECSTGLVIEKTFTAIYYLLGNLDSRQYADYLKHSWTVINYCNGSISSGSVIQEFYLKHFKNNQLINKGYINKYRSDVIDNVQIPGSLYEAVVSHRRFDMYTKSITDIMNSLAVYIKEKNTDMLMSGSGEISYYVIVLIGIICGILPFIVLSAKRTTRSLLIYAVTMEKKNVELKREKRKIDAILNQMLPRGVAYRLKKGDQVSAEEFEECTVFFSDIEDFGEISTKSAPMQIVGFLNEIYNFMDKQLGRYDVYKVETIGCVYMVVSGVPMRNGKRHATEIARMALDTIYVTEHFAIAHLPGKKLQLRIGAHTGPVVAGVIGNKTPRYCLFGDTVNTASRMQSSGKARKIHISTSTKAALDEVGGFYTKERGTVEIKGKGSMTTYWLISRQGALYDNNISGGSEAEEEHCG